MVTDSALKKIMPNLSDAKWMTYLPFLQRALTEFAVNRPLREAAFLAQVAHESGEFRWMEEIWGPTAAQKKYEPPSDTAAKLGNTQPGDGKRFKGRGPIQITGRANYGKYGSLLSVDLVNHPEKAATPEVGFRVAGLFWQRNGLNELADREMFETITKKINGGLNGYEDRLKYYTRAKQVLGVTATRAVLEPVSDADLLALPEFTRGHEVLDAEPPRRRPARKTKRVSKKSTAKKAVPKAGKNKTNPRAQRRTANSKQK